MPTVRTTLPFIDSSQPWPNLTRRTLNTPIWKPRLAPRKSCIRLSAALDSYAEAPWLRLFLPLPKGHQIRQTHCRPVQSPFADSGQICGLPSTRCRASSACGLKHRATADGSCVCHALWVLSRSDISQACYAGDPNRSEWCHRCRSCVRGLRQFGRLMVLDKESPYYFLFFRSSAAPRGGDTSAT